MKLSTPKELAEKVYEQGELTKEPVAFGRAIAEAAIRARDAEIVKMTSRSAHCAIHASVYSPHSKGVSDGIS
jgi:hypothetical protein